jgi:hypothetical protein
LCIRTFTETSDYRVVIFIAIIHHYTPMIMRSKYVRIITYLQFIWKLGSKSASFLLESTRVKIWLHPFTVYIPRWIDT